MDANALVQSSRAWFETGRTRPRAFREVQLRALDGAIAAHEERLLAALQADLRKPALEAYASEIGLVRADIAHALRELPRWMRPQRRHTPLLSRPGQSAVVPEPRGVVLIFGPWNYPFQLLFAPLVGALAAGNGAVIKPSEFAPHTSAAMAALIGSSFDPNYVRVVEGDAAVAAALLEARFDHIFFTGGTETGRRVMAAAARHLTPVTLELGGKCPCIVAADAPLATAVRRILRGKFMNAGQTCVAPDYVLVHASVRDRFLEAAAPTLAAFYGPDAQRSPDYGRIVNRRHFDRLAGYLGEGRVACGGQRDVADLYIAPTLLADVPADARVMQEEIFGPILPVLAYEDLDAVLADLRRRPAPLALYLFTARRDVQCRVREGTRSGGLCINDTVTQIAGADLPFGGVGDSGMGAYHGRASFDTFTHYRSELVRPFRPDFRATYPPYRMPLALFRHVFRLLRR